MQSLAHSSTMSAEWMNLKNEERKMRMDRKGLSLPLKSSQSTAWMGEVGREMYKYIGVVMKKYHGPAEEENHLRESGMAPWRKWNLRWVFKGGDTWQKLRNTF